MIGARKSQCKHEPLIFRGALPTPLDADYYDTALGATYTQTSRYSRWEADLGLTHELYNWYGLESGVFTQDQIDGIGDAGQRYLGVALGGRATVKSDVFKTSGVKFNYFTDKFDSRELRLRLNPNFEFPLSNENVDLGVHVDYLNGTFDNWRLSSTENNRGRVHNYLLAGVKPTLDLEKNGVNLTVGVDLTYGANLEASSSNFYIYPIAKASYELQPELAIAYVSLTGGLQQNSYQQFAADNPYVAPALRMRPTDEKYNVAGGLKGLLPAGIGYDVALTYVAANNMPLYLLAPRNLSRADEPYAYGNSYRIFYDDVTSFGGKLELTYDLSQKMSVLQA